MALILHRGAVRINRGELKHIPVPPAAGIFQPVPHADLADAVEFQLNNAGWEIVGEQHAVGPQGRKYFGYYELQDKGGYAVVVGFRSSYDKSLAIRLAMGSRVFICDNLALMGDIEVFRKHTTNVALELADKIAAGIAQLPQFIKVQDDDFNLWKEHSIDRRETDHAIGEIYRAGVITRSHLGGLFDEVRNQDVDHGPYTLWRMFNATTHILKSDTETGGIVNLPDRTARLHSLVRRLQQEFQL